MKSIRFVLLVVLCLLMACKYHTPSTTVIVLDTSLSITPRAGQAAIGERILHLDRGDRIILVPITNDARNDTGGRILRLQAPTARESYDADLKRFRIGARKQFAAWGASLDTHQSHTDILGALDVALQEFIVLPKETNRRLIVVSDFIEDDGLHDFVRDKGLADPASSRTIAARLRTERSFTLPGVPICLGRLESNDFVQLTEERKAAVQVFWDEYLSDVGHTPLVHFDGAGLLADADQKCLPDK
ncbi:MAG: hypothetical protein P4K83_11685 [Terracidiphilus sp.]|nr:hypothetical protein [Terracidiphilus sp.]